MQHADCIIGQIFLLFIMIAAVEVAIATGA